MFRPLGLPALARLTYEAESQGGGQVGGGPGGYGHAEAVTLLCNTARHRVCGEKNKEFKQNQKRLFIK